MGSEPPASSFQDVTTAGRKILRFFIQSWHQVPEHFFLDLTKLTRILALLLSAIDWKDFNTGIFFNLSMARLKDAGIPYLPSDFLNQSTIIALNSL
ncbi:MAG TPA: hypothetical protein ENH32_07410 [Proteobacteria bacterium]|nr:hypothetical protein [Pseudomonadota bacterium]